MTVLRKSKFEQLADNVAPNEVHEVPCLYHGSSTKEILKMSADPLEPGLYDTWLLYLP